MRIATRGQTWRRDAEGMWWQSVPHLRIVATIGEAELLDAIADGSIVDVVMAELDRRWRKVEVRRTLPTCWLIQLEGADGNWHDVEADTLGDAIATALEVRP